LGWIYFPSTFTMGPTFDLVEYRQILKGRPFTKSGVVYSLQLLFISLICLGINQVGILYYPMDILRDESFLKNNPLYIYVSCMIFTFIYRYKYYFGFKIAEGAAVMGGLGYNGIDKETKKEKWDGINNMDILRFEFAQSFRDSSLAWNKKTSFWLRRIVYDRFPRYNLYAVYLVSAIWHGFYPGYYLSFISLGILTGVNRIVHNTVLPRVIAMGPTAIKIYDILSWLTATLVRDYYILSFCLLEFEASMRLYGSMKYFIHILSLLAVVIFYSGIIKPIKEKKNL